MNEQPQSIVHNGRTRSLPPTKTCRACHQLKDRSEFSIEPRLMDGLKSYCRECCRTKDNEKSLRNKAKNLVVSVDGSKHCGSCGETKPAVQFYVDRRKHDGRKTACKACEDKRLGKNNFPQVSSKVCSKCGIVKDAVEFLPMRRNRTGLASYCRECDGNARSARNLADPKGRWEANLRRYGITVQERQDLLASQDGHCALCPAKEGEGKGHAKRLHVDHDHKTGKVRALLCSRCNLVIGQVEEDRELLFRMIQYVIKYQGEANA